MNFKPVFQIDTIEYGAVDWCYANQEKQWHTSWIVKKSDIIISTKLSAKDKKIVLNQLMPFLEKDNQMVRDHNNKKARQRRARRE